ncbi:MAG: MBL fold metallo-hydrolase [Sphingomonadaceae bacterium]|nr:MBL fold metallo-hydrolase [Sphingomonadaceae bacterium]
MSFVRPAAAIALSLALIANTPASDSTAALNQSVMGQLPINDRQDYDDAMRGKLAELDKDILNEDGSLSWPIKRFDFLAEPPADTANPSLWRQSRLSAIHGLFEVMPGIYQIRGYDLSVMTLIRGKTGWIVVDPLLTPAPAKAGLELANRTLGELPVVAVIYTHSHADHFGGVRGVTSAEALAAGKVQIIAPHGFMAETVGESVLAGTAMSRRAQYQFGAGFAAGPDGVIGVGLGPALSVGPIGLLPPTLELPVDGKIMDIDGVTFEFMDAGGTEAPSELVFYLPQYRALHSAEVATRNFHNVLTPRGALVRDALKWSRVIDAMLVRFGAKSDVILASHHWPAWGTDTVQQRLRNQRDMYRYVHDQTLRMANQGYTMDEIAEAIGEPDFAAQDFSTRGYYGTYKHNAKAVYQRYFGWWNGVPADYDALPKTEEARKWVAALGGGKAALAKAQAAHDGGDYRWAATLGQTLVFAEPDNAAARKLLAATYLQLAYQSEGGTWRNIYLAGAKELEAGERSDAPDTTSLALISSIPTADLFDALASRFNPAKMPGEEAIIQFSMPDTGEAMTVDLRKSVMFPRPGTSAGYATKLTINRTDFNLLLAQQASLPALMQAGKASIEGDPAHLAHMFGALDTPQPQFPIVTP